MSIEDGRIPSWFVVHGEITSVSDDSLIRYLSQPAALETESTIGNESNQLRKPSVAKASTTSNVELTRPVVEPAIASDNLRSREKRRKRSIINDTAGMTPAETVAMLRGD